MKPWSAVPLSEIAAPSGRAARDQTELPVYSVTKHRGFVASLQYFKKQVFSRELKSYTVVEPGEFAYSTIHLDEGAIGICPEKCLISPMYTAFRIISESVYPDFLLRYLKSPIPLAEYSRLGKGSVERRRAISFERLGQLHVPIPALAEQRRVVEILNRADALRAKRREALVQLNALTQSIFFDMFGDPATNPKGWPVATLEELLVEFRYGTSHKSENSGKPTLRIPNVIAGSIDLENLKLVPVSDEEFRRLQLRDGDLLFVRTNGNPDSVGRCAVFQPAGVESSGYPGDEFIFASYLIRARLVSNKVDPIFLREYLSTAEGRRQLRGRSKTSAGQYNINTEGLGSIKVLTPPKSLQQRFAARIAAVDGVRRSYLAGLAELNNLFNSLQERAFNGELSPAPKTSPLAAE